MGPKVIYVAGASYSGSTILGALLGMHPESMCAGELGNWTMRAGSQDLPCSCGVTRRDCPFWSRVRAAWLENGHPGWPGYKGLQRRFERLRSVPVLDLERRLHPVQFETYADLTRRLYSTLQQISGKDIIFDISKRAGRAQALDRIPGLDVSYIHLVRDGRGFITSSLKHRRQKWEQAGKQGPSPAAFFVRASLEWVMTNRTVENVLARSRRPSLRLRYEDFASNPAGALDAIAAAFSIDLTAVRTVLDAGQPVDFGHMGGGNRVRLAGPAALRLDESWKGSLSPAMERLFWSLAGATARKYGYTRL